MVRKYSLVISTFTAVAALALMSVAANAQTRAPREETLLNGLRVAIFSDRSAPTVTIRLRVNAGSSFDPQGKEGAMRMLSETIFLTDEARQYFSDDLGGSFELVNNYDHIQINITVRNDAMLEALETLANGVTTPQISKESNDIVRTRVRGQLDRLLASPSYQADMRSAKRLFGTFPYGRPIHGTPESLQQIDFADLRFAYDRLFGADNSLLTVHGNVDAGDTYRAVRRFFGAWLKSDRRIPSTFRQPEVPDSSLEVLNISSENGAEVRHLVRGFARGDKEAPAADVLAKILDKRLKDRVSSVSSADSEVRSDSNVLPGTFVFAISGIAPEAKVKLYPTGDSVDARGLISSIMAGEITSAEFSAAKTEVAAAMRQRPVDENWLDLKAYNIPSRDVVQSYESVTLAEVQRVAATIRSRPTVNLWMVKGIGTK